MQRFTTFDFGLTGLAALFHQDWIHLGEVEQVVLAYLSVGEEPCADEDQKKEAAELEKDVAALTGSSLSDDQVELLWTMATGGNYPFRHSETGRTFLERIKTACRQWVRTYGTIDADSNPKWISTQAMSEVRRVIGDTPLNLPDECRTYFDSDAQALRNALDGCAHSASADLAFRLLLRIHVANFIPVDETSWGSYAGIARRLSLGEDLLSSVEFLVN
ncbi:hypothetical protein [Streptomyces decoyicus]|uniref:hypothetical protein n=1 Tax=Streptomyces decoyicus TaxID=249567 RepID=UPI00386A3561|nr:hypothetical protein OG532_28595 [Streptomyces decoyicus]